MSHVIWCPRNNKTNYKSVFVPNIYINDLLLTFKLFGVNLSDFEINANILYITIELLNHANIRNLFLFYKWCSFNEKNGDFRCFCINANSSICNQVLCNNCGSKLIPRKRNQISLRKTSDKSHFINNKHG